MVVYDIALNAARTALSIIVRITVVVLVVKAATAGQLRISNAPGSQLWHYAAKLRTISAIYHLCVLVHTNTMNNNVPTNLTYLCLVLSYTILQGPHIPSKTFTSCYEPKSNHQMREQALNLTANPTCFCSRLSSCQLKDCLFICKTKGGNWAEKHNLLQVRGQQQI